MKRAKKIEVTLEDIIGAAHCAIDGHKRQPEVKAFMKDMRANCERLYAAYLGRHVKKFIRYDRLHKVNTNGKKREIDRPSLDTRIYQWLVINKLRPLYEMKDPHVGFNCKPGCGIQGRAQKRKNGERVGKEPSRRTKREDRRNSVLKRIKHLCYDEREYEWALLLDQRKCYEHIHPKHFRKAVKALSEDKRFNDFATEVSFVEDKLPVGTPTSPFVHHVIMLGFDLWLTGAAPWRVRYADNILLAFETKEEANRAKWRVQNYWWYEYGLRAKRHEVVIQPLDQTVRLCGYEVTRNKDKGIVEHNKGFTRVRENILNRAKRSSEKGWGSYFGILSHADEWRIMREIEKNMKLSELTESIRITRHLDAVNLDIKQVLGEPVVIKDYEVRYDKDNKPNWVKLLIALQDKEDPEKILAREIHGGYTGLAQFLYLCEQQFSKKDILPIEDAVILNQCGYIFKGSTNQIEYF